MRRLFPAELVDCIGDARSPQQHELATLADKIWHEAFEQGIAAYQLAVAVALVALAGSGAHPVPTG